jgi:hypothetical protein
MERSDFLKVGVVHFAVGPFANPLSLQAQTLESAWLPDSA